MKYLQSIHTNILIFKIFIHGINTNSIYEYFPKRIFPKDYSGFGESMDTIINNWKTKLIVNRGYLLKEEQFGYNIIKKSEIINDDLEVHGTFRKLQID